MDKNQCETWGLTIERGRMHSENVDNGRFAAEPKICHIIKMLLIV